MKNIKVMSIFSGIGAFEMAMKQLEENNETKLKSQLVGYSEIDKYAIKTYEKHFTGIENIGDIKKIDTSSIEDFELLVGGSPCQNFSINGKREGIKGKDGVLIFEYLRFLNEKRPKFFIFENVRGLLSQNKGKDFEFIKSKLDEYGYNFVYKVLNSKNFGSPQNRERVFIFGMKKDLGEFNFEIPSGNGKTSVLKDILDENVDEKYFLSSKRIKKLYKGNSMQNRRFCHPNNISFCLTKSGVKNIMLNKSKDFVHDFSYKKLKNKSIKDDIIARKLHPNEYEKIQGFPVGYTYGVSDSQRYKQIGNSISIQVLTEIIGEFFKYIEKNNIL